MKVFTIKVTGYVYIKADSQEVASAKLHQGFRNLPPEIYDFDYATGIDGWEEIKEEDQGASPGARAICTKILT